MQRIIGSYSVASAPNNSEAASFSHEGGPGGILTQADVPSSRRSMLRPLCVFTCYWGQDKTPVVVGLQQVVEGSRGPEAQGGSHRGYRVVSGDMDAGIGAQRKPIRQLDVSFAPSLFWHHCWEIHSRSMCCP